MGEYFELVFFIQLLKITLVEAFTKSCNASLQTVSIVTACPTNDSSYQIAAQKKNCSSFSLDSSSCESFQYHCVLSEDLKSAIEVCAPSLNIIGHSCAMFNNKHQGIMRVDNMTCGNTTEGCPFSYKSTSAFKYQQCFPIESQLHTTEATLRSSSSKTKDDRSLIIIIVIVILAIAVIICVILLSLYLKRRYTRREPGQVEIEMDQIPEVDIQENNLEQPLLDVRNERELDIQKDTTEQPQMNEQNEPGGIQVVDISTEDLVEINLENGDELQAMAKIDVNTLEKDEGNKTMLECSMNLLVNLLKDPYNTWSKEKIIQKVENMIQKLENSREGDLLVKFIKTIDQDKNIQPKLIKCGEEMFDLISSVQEKYSATKVEIINGCVCFIFSFADYKSLKNLLNDFSTGSKCFRNYISRILLNQTFLGIFQIHPENVTWKARELKVFKGSKMEQEAKPESPITGTYEDITEDDQDHKGQEERQEENIEKTLDAFSVSTYSQYPAYKRVKTREMSFDHCNENMKKRAGEFARDGFYYEGYGRATSCFHCGCAKEDWTDQDEIHSKHLELNETCAFVNYVQSIISKAE